jgi:hypothetical protein
MTRSEPNGRDARPPDGRPERRRSPRRRFAWPIVARFGGGEPVRSSTANIGAGGVLFHVPNDRAPEPGTPVDVVLHVPPSFQDRVAYYQYRAEGSGRVVRVEDAGAPDVPVRGVAVEFDRPVHLLETFVGLP